VASRFGVVLTQSLRRKLSLVGALGGASVNYLFIEHFRTQHRVISPRVGWKERMERTLYGRSVIALLRTTEVQLSPLSALAMRPMVIWLADLTRSVESDAQIGERK
jgi:hypothetical protein